MCLEVAVVIYMSISFDFKANICGLCIFLAVLLHKKGVIFLLFSLLHHMMWRDKS